MSLFRTPSPRKSTKFHLAVTVPAVATMAAIAGAAGVWTAGAAAQPTAMARPAGHVRQASPESARVTPSAVARNQPQLDALLEVAAAPKGTVATTGVVKGDRKRAATPRQIARSMLRHFGWSRSQFRYLNSLWSHESSWRVHAENAVLRCLRDPAGGAGRQDGHRGQALADQSRGPRSGGACATSRGGTAPRGVPGTTSSRPAGTDRARSCGLTSERPAPRADLPAGRYRVIITRCRPVGMPC